MQQQCGVAVIAVSAALLLLSAVNDVEFGSGFRSPISSCSPKAKSFSCSSLMDILHNLVSREEKAIAFRLLLSSVSVSEGHPCAAALSAGLCHSMGLAGDASICCPVVGHQQYSASSRTEVESEREKGAGSGVGHTKKSFPSRMQLHYGRRDQSSESQSDSNISVPVLPARIPPGAVVSVRAALHGGALPGAVLS